LRESVFSPGEKNKPPAKKPAASALISQGRNPAQISHNCASSQNI